MYQSSCSVYSISKTGISRVYPLKTYRLLFSQKRHQKACSVHSSLINFDSKQENPELTKNLALGKIDNYKGSVHIFTDASNYR